MDTMTSLGEVMVDLRFQACATWGGGATSLLKYRVIKMNGQLKSLGCWNLNRLTLLKKPKLTHYSLFVFVSLFPRLMSSSCQVPVLCSAFYWSCSCALASETFPLPPV